MINEKAPCPYCNTLIWIGVPDGRRLVCLGLAKDYDSNALTRMLCPSCSNTIVVWVGKK